MANIIEQTTRTIKHWWLFIIYGILLIAFSIWVFWTPLESYIGLALAFSVLVFVNGGSHIYFSLANRKNLSGWGWFLASGILEVVIGFVLIMYPGISVATLPFIIGFWVMLKAGFLIGLSIDLKRFGFMDWGWLMASGILLTLLSFFMILHPIFGALTVVGWTGAAFMFFGISYIMLAFRLKKLKGMSLDKIDNLKDHLQKEAMEFKAKLVESFKSGMSEAGEEADKIKNEVEAKVDEFIKDLDVKTAKQ